ncbi:MAG: NHL repeat-containing protein [Bryobacteraceae bacterium]
MSLRAVLPLAILAIALFHPSELRAQANPVSYAFQFGNSVLRLPTAVAVDGVGNIYVLDAQTATIEKFTSSGAWVTRFREVSPGDISIPGFSPDPVSVAVDRSGNIYIADGSNRMVQKLDSSGRFVRTIEPACQYGRGPCADPDVNGPRPFVYPPLAVTVDSQDFLYVSGVYEVQKFTTGGSLVSEFPFTGIIPKKIAVDRNSKVVMWEGDSGWVLEYDQAGNLDPAFTNRPFFRGVGGVATDAGGNIYVADWQNARVVKLSPTGAQLSSFGTLGAGPGQFGADFQYGPAGIAIDPSGRIVVVDTVNHRVEVFTNGGESRTVDSSTGMGPVTFTTSTGTFTNLMAIPDSQLPKGKPFGVKFPYGVFYWTLAGLAPGQTVTITMTLPAPIKPPVQFWKVLQGAWVRANSLIGSDDGDNVLTLTITDGGFGDADGAANGTIIDPGGAGIVSLAPFAAFQAKGELKQVSPGVYEFGVKDTVTLGAASDGIRPLVEDVTVRLGSLEVVIPAGSFRQDSKGRFKFEGIIGGVTVSAMITPLGGRQFEFRTEGSNARLTGGVNPVTVGLVIGDDGGSAEVKVEME